MDIKKYCFEYRFSSGIDIDLTPEEARQLQGNESLIRSKTFEAINEFNIGNAEYEKEGEYPEILGLDTDKPYLHTRIYGRYAVISVGETFEECERKAYEKYLDADLGDFALDCEKEDADGPAPIPLDYISLLDGIDSERNMKYVGLNLDECGYSVKIERIGLGENNISVEIYKRDVEQPDSNIYAFGSAVGIDGLFENGRLIFAKQKLSLEDCKEILGELVLNGVNRLTDKVKPTDKTMPEKEE